MPASAVKTDRDERLWREAKKQAAKQGKGSDYAYVMGIFQRMRKGEKDQIPGGLASGKKPSDFDPRALAAGTKVEMEHVNAEHRGIAREIAMDHLTEDRRYYEKLATIEKSITAPLEEWLEKAGPAKRKGKGQVGEIREWKGGRYQKTAEGKWKPVGSAKGAKKQQEPGDDNWKKVGDGYSRTLPDGRTATLSKEGKKWSLEFEGQTHELPRRASFDHADGMLRDLAGGGKAKGDKGAKPKPKARAPKPKADPKAKPEAPGAATKPEPEAAGPGGKKQAAAKPEPDPGAQGPEKAGPETAAKEGGEQQPAQEAGGGIEPSQDLDVLLKAALAKHGEEAIKGALEKATKGAAAAIDAKLQERAKGMASHPEVAAVGQQVAKALSLTHDQESQPGADVLKRATEKAAKAPAIQQAAKAELSHMSEELGDVVAEHAAKATGEKDAKPSKVKAILKAAIKGGLPSFAFGFIDNFIMYMAGASIDKGIATMGFSAAAVAGLGNAISDTVGEGVSGKIEDAFERVGLGKDETEGVLDEKTENRIKRISSMVGIFTGCIAGMVPMLFGVSFGKSRRQEDDMIKGLYPSDDVIGWAGQFYGSPLYLEALKCLKEQSQIEKDRAKLRGAEKDWDALQELPRAQREAQREKERKAREPLEKRQQALSAKRAALEERLVDHKIKEAEGMGKSLAAPDELRKSVTHAVGRMLAKNQAARRTAARMQFGSVPIHMGGADLAIEALASQERELGVHAAGRPSLKKGTIYQGESLCPAGGDDRESQARAQLSAEIAVMDPAGQDGNGGLAEWWADAERVRHAERVPVGQGMAKSAGDPPPTRVIDDSSTYQRHLQRMSHQDGQANLDYLFHADNPDRR